MELYYRVHPKQPTINNRACVCVCALRCIRPAQRARTEWHHQTNNDCYFSQKLDKFPIYPSTHMDRDWFNGVRVA